MRLKKEIKFYSEKSIKSQGKADLEAAYKILGFKSNNDFLNFCFENKIIIRKNLVTRKQIELIKYLKNEKRIQGILYKSNLIKNADFVEAYEMHKEGISGFDVKNFKIYFNLIDKKKDKDFKKFIFKVCKRKEIVEESQKIFVNYNDKDYAKLINKIYEYKDFWVNDYTDWNSKKMRNSWDTIKNLISHLFEKYPTPDFLKSVWFGQDPDDRGIELYLKIAQGESAFKSLKTFAEQKSGIALTKKEAHRFINKKSNNCFEFTFKEFLLDSWNIKRKIKDEVLKNRDMLFVFQNDLFLKEFLLLINKEEFFEIEQLFPLWDYVLHLKRLYENENKIFTFKGRSIIKLLNDMYEWHAKMDTKKSKVWSRNYDIDEYYEVVKKEGEFNAVQVCIKELCSSKELASEGKAMKNCVVSYSRKCINGVCQIWSMYKVEYGQLKRRMTIETVDGRIVQARGSCNKKPEKSDVYYLEKWARENNLNLQTMI